MTRATQHWPPLAEAINLYESGWSLRQIAAHTHTTQPSVRSWLLRSGVVMRTPGGCVHEKRFAGMSAREAELQRLAARMEVLQEAQKRLSENLVKLSKRKLVLEGYGR